MGHDRKQFPIGVGTKIRGKKEAALWSETRSGAPPWGESAARAGLFRPRFEALSYKDYLAA